MNNENRPAIRAKYLYQNPTPDGCTLTQENAQTPNVRGKQRLRQLIRERRRTDRNAETTDEGRRSRDGWGGYNIARDRRRYTRASPAKFDLLIFIAPHVQDARVQGPRNRRASVFDFVTHASDKHIPSHTRCGRGESAAACSLVNRCGTGRTDEAFRTALSTTTRRNGGQRNGQPRTCCNTSLLFFISLLRSFLVLRLTVWKQQPVAHSAGCS